MIDHDKTNSNVMFTEDERSKLFLTKCLYCFIYFTTFCKCCLLCIVLIMMFVSLKFEKIKSLNNLIFFSYVIKSQQMCTNLKICACSCRI